jgi:hypothetical protein
MTEELPLNTLAEIKEAAVQENSNAKFYFSEGSTRFAGSEYEKAVYLCTFIPGTFFVEKNQDVHRTDPADREPFWTVRHAFYEDGRLQIKQITPSDSLRDSESAHKFARKAARLHTLEQVDELWNEMCESGDL